MSSAPASSLSSSLTRFYNAHSNVITAAVAATAALTFAAVHYGGFSQLIDAVTGKVSNSRAPRPVFKEEQLLRHVFARAAQGNPQSVLAVMDDFGWKIQWMMAVGDEKGAIVRAEVANRQPRVAVELGGYCGYSAVLIGAQLPPSGHLYSIELDPLHAAIATKIIEYAGLRDRVTVLVGSLEQKLPALRSTHGVTAIDLLFIDHDKRAYLSDMQRVEASGLLVSGSVVVADNVIYPGAPDYLEHVQAQEGRVYRTVMHHSKVEYSNEGKNTPDAVAVSIKL